MGASIPGSSKISVKGETSGEEPVARPIEAMKMECHHRRMSGVVESILIHEGDTVKGGSCC